MRLIFEDADGERLSAFKLKLRAFWEMLSSLLR